MEARSSSPAWGAVALHEAGEASQGCRPDGQVAAVAAEVSRWPRWQVIAGSVSAAVTVLALVAAVLVCGTDRVEELSAHAHVPHLRQRPGAAQALPQIKLTTAERCLELEGCPDMYPIPYEFGKWPQEYKYNGSFPKGFAWGVATASYQVEGGYREGGRGASIWDTFTGADTVDMPGAHCSYCCKRQPCTIGHGMQARGSTGNVASDHYHMVDADVALMKSMGLRHYRFSIAWPRLFPTGRAADGVNAEGVAFYSRLIDKLLAASITPYVTLYHWDLPQGLLDPPRKLAWWARDPQTGEPKGEILGELLAYADTCFTAFGDRVKWWSTFNDPWTFTYLASGGGHAPSHPELSNRSIHPFVAGHNVLNAHAAVVDLYRSKYQQHQGGKIGILLSSEWREPKSADRRDVAAAARGVELRLGWYSDPIFGGQGDYPPLMRKLYGSRLPQFTAEQRRLLNGSADFYGLIHVGTGWSAFANLTAGADPAHAHLSEDQIAGAGWGLRKLLSWVHRRYRGLPAIHVTDGGRSTVDEAAADGARDSERTLHIANSTAELWRAIHEDGVDVRGYFALSFLDGFDWTFGFAKRRGTVYNDFGFGMDTHSPRRGLEQPTPHGQVRTRKRSSCWLEAVWTANALVDPGSSVLEGCAAPDAFRASFVDTKRAGCKWHIVVDKYKTTGHVRGTDNAKGDRCDGKGDGDLGPFPAMFSGGTVVVDFSLIGGPPSVAGFWNEPKQAIDWADGNSWAREGAAGRRAGHPRAESA